jgi:uncharacterized delta-60 repeat protein
MLRIVSFAVWKRLLQCTSALALLVGVAPGVALAQTAGSLDTTFGNGGSATTAFASETLVPIGALEQSNGDIVVLSQFDIVEDVGTQIALTRYTSAGVLDTTFGTRGSTTTAFSAFSFNPFAFAAQANGEIIVAGTVSTSIGGFGLARFTANGVLDTTFGNAGVVAVQVGTRIDAPSSFLLQPNGQILMAGLEDGSGNNRGQNGVPGALSLARFDSDGVLDATFGASGIALVTPAIGAPQALAILSNGDYLAVGASQTGAFPVVELSSTGVLQSTITGGTVTASSPLQGLGEFPTVFESNGNYVVSNLIAPSRFTTTAEVLLFGDTGVQDSAFATVRIPFAFGGGKNVGQAIAVQSNGQVVVGIGASSPTTNSGGLARLDTNGELDTTFGTGGTLALSIRVSGLLIEANGDIVAVGEATADSIEVVRVLAN